MLSSLVKEHQSRQSALRKANDKAAAEAAEAASQLTRALVAELNEGVADVFTAQKLLETQTRHLQNSLGRFSKLSSQWISMIDNFNTALKEIGDVENWAERIEADMREVADALTFVCREELAETEAARAAAAAAAPTPEQSEA